MGRGQIARFVERKSGSRMREAARTAVARGSGMIIEAREDVVTLRGKLSRNEWQNIKAAANHLLHNHPYGIIIDCSHIELPTQEGIETFIDARRDIEALGARIILCNVPRDVLDAMRSVPGASSQLPVARGADEARSAFRLLHAKSPLATAGRSAILVPLLGPGDAEIAVPLACRLAPRERALIHLLYVVPVPRALPLGAPLGELECVIEAELARAETIVRQRNIPVYRHIEQTRLLSDAILNGARRLCAPVIVLGLRDLGEEDESGREETVLTLLRQATCEVVIARSARVGIKR
jgi:anti-anti-sigma regulatory factor/nucleotide-binding universal stress UspA family protein